MSQPDESREKTPKTDAVLMHPDNDPHKSTGGAAPRKDHAEIQVERDGELVPLDQDE
ncbi:hypothetical protein [Micromonospora luteifusca]|uniref:Multidrug transporter n=1 Tax=Micromonospora luteifusca TaxID=709860 RepID=A0ABS2LZI8_9ACTN|nr:hypothetical protein [Micromonospora luteifusca]MBM7493577.1 hypothetical protein [Micromonospora luteifusca]